MQRKLAREFKDTAADAQAQFPEALNTLLLVTKTAKTPVYVSPEIAAHLRANVVAVKEAIKKAGDDLYKLNAGGFATRWQKIADKPVKMIAIDDAPHGIFSEKYTKEMRLNYVLDHELGHYVVKSGMAGGHRGESAADAFGALRHIQRYGMETEFFEYNNKSSTVVLDTSPMHYTHETMKRAREIATERDVTQLSLTETAQLAEEISTACAFQYHQLWAIENAFSRAGRVYRDKLGTKQEIGEKMYARDPEAFKLFVQETRRVAESTQLPDVRLAAQRFFDWPPMKKYLLENPQALTDPLPPVPSLPIPPPKPPVLERD